MTASFQNIVHLIAALTASIIVGRLLQHAGAWLQRLFPSRHSTDGGDEAGSHLEFQFNPKVLDRVEVRPVKFFNTEL